MRLLLVLAFLFIMCCIIASASAEPPTGPLTPHEWRVTEVYKNDPASFGYANPLQPDKIIFKSFCSSEDCLDRAYDVFIETRDVPTTDYAIVYCLKNEWEQWYGKPLYKLDFDPLWEGDFPHAERLVVCEYGAGCQFVQ